MENTTDNEEFPVCPGCGERHPPTSDQLKAVFGFIMEKLVPELSAGDALSVMGSVLVALLERLPVRTRISVLSKLGYASGITDDVLDAVNNGVEPAKRVTGVDLSRFTPRGKAN